MIGKDEKIIVQSLIGAKQLAFYLRCLKSLVELGQDNFELHLHSDGTLSDENKELIFSELQGTVVNLSDSSENTNHIMDCLYRRPNCQNFRKDSIWGIEFFDPIFAFPDQQVSFYIDADILFLRPFKGLFDRDHLKNGAIFLRDTQWDAYCFRPWQLLHGNKKPQVVKGITTGLVFWDKYVIDWDYLEWFLGAHHLHNIPEWIMPTAQAGLANRCNAKTICPKQLTNLYPNAQIHEDTFGIHLLGSYREDWNDKLDMNGYIQSDNLRIIFPRLHNCENQNFIGYFYKQLRRWKNTRLNLW